VKVWLAVAPLEFGVLSPQFHVYVMHFGFELPANAVAAPAHTLIPLAGAVIFTTGG
jgi:hypothetical protein